MSKDRREKPQGKENQNEEMESSIMPLEDEQQTVQRREGAVTERLHNKVEDVASLCEAAAPSLSDIDSIVDEQVGSISSDIQRLLQEENIHYSIPPLPRHTPPHRSMRHFSQYVSFYNPSPPIQDYVSSLQESMSSMITELSENWQSHRRGTSRADPDTLLSSTVSDFVASIRAANTKTNDDRVPAPCGDLTAADGAASTSRQFPDTSNSRTPPSPHATSSLPTSASGSLHKTANAVVLHPSAGESPHHQHGYTSETSRTIGHTVGQIEDTRTFYCATDAEGGSSLSGSNPDRTPPGFNRVSEPSHPSEPASGSASQSVPATPPTAMSSLICQLQPEVFSNLLAIIKDLKKSPLKFYLHSYEPGDRVYDEIKVTSQAL